MSDHLPTRSPSSTDTSVGDPVAQAPTDRDVDAVRRDIERTREALARTAESLVDKLNVKNQTARTIEQARAKAAPVVRQVAERTAPHRTRILAGAGAALVVWLLVRRARH